MMVYPGDERCALQDVLKRMLGAISFRRDLFPEVESKPDLYGPFWIVTSIVFLMAMISNGLEWLAHRSDTWAGDPEKIVYGAIILYGYVFGAGLALWAWLKVINLASISLPALWCIFGACWRSELPADAFCERVRALPIQLSCLSWMGVSMLL